MEVTVWVCPTPGCGSYYASRSAGDLMSRRTGGRGPNGEHYPGREHSMSECADCRDRGRPVDRIPVLLDIPIPLPA